METLRFGILCRERTRHVCQTAGDEVVPAPALHYRIRCSGGSYVLWLLAKFNIGERAGFGVALDGEFWDRDALYRKGSLWRYESEQIYRWVPLLKAEIEAGLHELLLCPLSPGLRFDRIYLTKGKELPPMDGDWKAGKK